MRQTTSSAASVIPAIRAATPTRETMLRRRRDPAATTLEGDLLGVPLRLVLVAAESLAGAAPAGRFRGALSRVVVVPVVPVVHVDRVEHGPRDPHVDVVQPLEAASDQVAI